MCVIGRDNRGRECATERVDGGLTTTTALRAQPQQQHTTGDVFTTHSLVWLYTARWHALWNPHTCLWISTPVFAKITNFCNQASNRTIRTIANQSWFLNHHFINFFDWNFQPRIISISTLRLNIPMSVNNVCDKLGTAAEMWLRSPPKWWSISEF